MSTSTRFRLVLYVKSSYLLCLPFSDFSEWEDLSMMELEAAMAARGKRRQDRVYDQK